LQLCKLTKFASSWGHPTLKCDIAKRWNDHLLNVLDEFTRVSLGSKVSRSIGASSVIEHLEKLFETHGAPSAIRSDNGREFIASSVIEWLGEQGVEAVFIEKASPTQNPFIEGFNGTMRRDLLNVEDFNNVTEAQVLVDYFNEEYNELRPHRSLHMMTPHAFSQRHMVEVK
jgi:putative transposase